MLLFSLVSLFLVTSHILQFLKLHPERKEPGMMWPCALPLVRSNSSGIGLEGFWCDPNSSSTRQPSRWVRKLSCCDDNHENIAQWHNDHWSMVVRFGGEGFVCQCQLFDAFEHKRNPISRNDHQPRIVRWLTQGLVPPLPAGELSAHWSCSRQGSWRGKGSWCPVVTSDGTPVELRWRRKLEATLWRSSWPWDHSDTLLLKSRSRFL